MPDPAQSGSSFELVAALTGLGKGMNLFEDLRGNGMVVAPDAFLDELAQLEAAAERHVHHRAGLEIGRVHGLGDHRLDFRRFRRADAQVWGINFRRDIARIYTVMRERELGLSAAPTEDEGAA